jgi:hypothetical protein
MIPAPGPPPLTLAGLHRRAPVGFSPSPARRFLFPLPACIRPRLASARGEKKKKYDDRREALPKIIPPYFRGPDPLPEKLPTSEASESSPKHVQGWANYALFVGTGPALGSARGGRRQGRGIVYPHGASVATRAPPPARERKSSTPITAAFSSQASDQKKRFAVNGSKREWTGESVLVARPYGGEVVTSLCSKGVFLATSWNAYLLFLDREIAA